MFLNRDFCRRSSSLNRLTVAAAGFLSRCLNSHLLYVQRHITVNKMCWVCRYIKHFLPYSNCYIICYTLVLDIILCFIFVMYAAHVYVTLIIRKIVFVCVCACIHRCDIITLRWVSFILRVITNWCMVIICILLFTPSWLYLQWGALSTR